MGVRSLHRQAGGSRTRSPAWLRAASSLREPPRDYYFWLCAAQGIGETLLVPQCHADSSDRGFWLQIILAGTMQCFLRPAASPTAPAGQPHGGVKIQSRCHVTRCHCYLRSKQLLPSLGFCSILSSTRAARLNERKEGQSGKECSLKKKLNTRFQPRPLRERNSYRLPWRAGGGERVQKSSG